MALLLIILMAFAFLGFGTGGVTSSSGSGRATVHARATKCSARMSAAAPATNCPPPAKP
jgi:hypothetical protein